MADLDDPRMAALAPLTRRVRRDVTAVKRNGRQAWTDEPLTKLRLAQHLSGGAARGVCPILPGTSTTLVGLFDLDSHGGVTSWDRMAVAGAALVDSLMLAWGCEPVCFRSSGGRGIHVYLVWDEAQEARDVRRWMAGVLAGLGMRIGTRGVERGEVEVFPKQDRVPEGGFGNQFILPLAGASELLVPCELSGALVPTSQPLDASMWRGSPAVPITPPEDLPARPLRSRPLTENPQGGWLEALDAIPNGRGDGDGQDTSLGYDDWRNVIFAIHYETKGSAEGLELAREWSARSPKFDEAFLEERVWQYIRPERDRPITGNTICRLALSHGWRPTVPDDAFPRVPIDEAQAAAERETWARTSIVGLDGAASDIGAGDGAADGLSHVVEAQAVCTDLANANRVVAASGRQMMSLGGQWYVWDGKRFAPDAPAAMREVCALSKIIKREADEADATARRLLLSLEGVDALAAGSDLPKAKEIMKRFPESVNIRSDWGQRVKVIRPELDDTRLRSSGLTRKDVATALELSFSGSSVGLYRENDKLIPIVARLPLLDRGDAGTMPEVQVWSPLMRRYIPLVQVASDFRVRAEDPTVYRRNRMRTLTVECDASDGRTGVLFAKIRPLMEAVALPPGCALEWGGEFEGSQKAQGGLMRMIPLAFVFIVLILVMLFNAYRQVTIILLTLPLSLTGMTAGLLVFGKSFDFLALLGFLSLAGMLIKNAIVLIDQIDLEIREGKAPYAAIVDSALSRARPVLMAAMTTVLGMIPLYFDSLFSAMAVTIMFGLTFATALTLILVPVLYALLFHVSKAGSPAS